MSDRSQRLVKPFSLAAVCLLALVQACLLLDVAWDKSDTADETRYVASSASLWAHGELRDLCEAPALPKRGFGLALWLGAPEASAVPLGWQRASETLFAAKPAATLRSVFFSARCATITVLVLAGFYVWLAALRFGPSAAFISHAVWCFSPTLLANGSLATLDPWAAALMAFVLWAGTRLVECRTPLRILLLGAACGAAAATKITTLLVAPCVVALLAFLAFRTRRRAGVLVTCATWTSLFLISLVGSLWIIYGVTIGGISLGEPCPFSLEGVSPPAGWWPFPAWIEGVIFQLRHGREGHANYLFGQVNNTGWWWFYLACMGLKVAVGTQAMVLVGGAATIVELKRGALSRAWVDAGLLAYPALLLLAMSLGRHQANIGFLLPALPFVAVWLGRSVSAVTRAFGTPGTTLMYALLLVALVEALHVHPNYLMFYNIWAGGPEGGPRYLIHREDWGQDKRQLAEWQRRNGVTRLYYAAYGPNAEQWGIVYDPVPCEPTPGVYALHAVEVHRPRFSLRPGCIDWLTVEAPDERIGYSIYIYVVDEERIKRLKERPAREVFWRSGPEEAVKSAAVTLKR